MDIKKPESLILQFRANADNVTQVAEAVREISGLAAPYGPVGHSSVGPITFAKGSLTWEKPGRVKFLEQHDPERPLGFAKELVETDDGLLANFSVAEGPEGDRAIAMAKDGRRDGLSVGVRLSAETIDTLYEKMFEGDTSPTEAKGELFEISQVTIPAFSDARTDGSLAASVPEVLTLSVDFSSTNKEIVMEPTATPASASASAEVAAPAPSLMAGSAMNGVSEAPVYTFDGRGDSFVRDVWNAKFHNDFGAADRLAKFQAMLTGGTSSQAQVLTAAVETTVTAPNYKSSDNYSPNYLVSAIDKGRPMISRIGTYPLKDATPFRIPVDGTFSGVANHTEGQNHAAEGDLTLGDVTVSPVAVSGALRLSRELVDASNPAIDAVAVRAMARDYRNVTETKVAAALLAADGVADFNVNTVLKVRQSLNNFYDVMDEPATFVVCSTGLYGVLIADVDSTGRPHLAYLNPQNAIGQAPGFTGASVDGVELFKSSTIAVNDGFIVNAADVFIGESPLQTFRFDEVEGPGVVKLALWAYFSAKVTRASSVVQISSAAS